MIKAFTLEKCQADLQDILIKWVKWLSIEKNLSPHSIRAYCQDVTQFLDFLSAYHASTLSIGSISDSTVTDFRAWLSQKASKGSSATSRARALSGVKSFLTWMDKQGIAHNTGAFLINSPKKPKKLPRALEVPQAFRLLDEMVMDTWIDARNCALFTLLYGCGLRISESLSLNIRDLHDQRFLRVMGKGSKERMVPLFDQINIQINNYRTLCPYPETPDRALFLGSRGGRLHQAVIQRDMRSLRKQLNLPETATPHALRHSFASHLLQKGANLREIQTLLGHSSLSSTQIYTDLNFEELKEVYKKSHPRA